MGMACCILFGPWRIGCRVIWVGDLWIAPVGLVVVRVYSNCLLYPYLN